MIPNVIFKRLRIKEQGVAYLEKVVYYPFSIQCIQGFVILRCVIFFYGQENLYEKNGFDLNKEGGIILVIIATAFSKFDMN